LRLEKKASNKPVIVTGDFNVAHLDQDIWNCDLAGTSKLHFAGVTPEERNSHGEWLGVAADVNNGEKNVKGETEENEKSNTQTSKSDNNRFVDAFRALYGEARAHFTWWSMRTVARPENKGLRLDSFIITSDLLPPKPDTSTDTTMEKHVKEENGINGDKRNHLAVYDTYRLEEATVGVSDHCPIGFILRNV